MRCTPSLLKKELYRFEWTIPVKPRYEIKLRNHVAGQGKNYSTTPCVQEMFNMIACLKKAEFNESECTKEIDLFQKCSIRSPGVKFFPEYKKKSVGNKSTIEINELLKKHPQP